MNNLYLQISSECLADYVGSATLAPAIYYTNRPQDIQSIYKNGLMLCKSIFSVDANCSIQVELSECEVKSLKWMDDDYALFSGWLPISRVVNISFKDSKQAKQTIWDINTGVGYVPDKIVKVDGATAIPAPRHLSTSKHNKVDSNVERELYRFNYLLGVLSFVRVLRESYEDSTLNFSTFALSIHSYFSGEIKKQFVNQGGELDTRYNSFLSKESKHEDLKSLILSDLSYDLLNEKYRVANRTDLPKNFNLVDVDKLEINNQYYSFFVASNYVEAGPKSDSDLVSDITSTKLKYKLDGISFTFGMHWGYKKLRNAYGKDLNKKKVKLSLDSIFDLITLEDLYKFVSGGDSLSLEFAKKAKHHSDDIKSLDYKTYSILDQVFYVERKSFDKGLKSLVRRISERLQSIFNNNIFQLNQDNLEHNLFEGLQSQYGSEFNKIKNDSLKIINNLIEKNESLLTSNEDLKLRVDLLENQIKGKDTVPEESLEILTTKTYPEESIESAPEIDDLKPDLQRSVPLEITNKDDYKRGDLSALLDNNDDNQSKDKPVNESLMPDKKPTDSIHEKSQQVDTPQCEDSTSNKEQEGHDLANLSVSKLKGICDKKGLKYKSRLKKAELVALIKKSIQS